MDKTLMIKTGRLLCAAALFLGFCGLAFAHHGTGAEYDSHRRMTMKGTVTEFAWANPHVQIYFDAKDDKGKVVHWGCETLSPGKLVRMGWTRNSLKAGDEITITLDPAKNGAPVGDLRKLVLANGQELKLRGELPKY
jgi:Family of unknown function (DUF6152)